jgi:hypothetical protein
MIDCDVHPSVPTIKELLPYFDAYWQEMIEVRGIDGFVSGAYPPNAPLTCRPDFRTETSEAALAKLRGNVLGKWGSELAICSSLYGVQLIHDDYLAAAFARAVNDWMVKEWLDREPRLRASIVVSPQNPELAVEEIERLAADKRFVQVLLLASGDMPLGKNFYWPIYAAAEKHGLAIGIHAGSAYRRAPTSAGWVTYFVEDYVAHSQSFQAQLASLISHGVFGKFPGLKVVLMESGFTWLPAFLWRFEKFWWGLRIEVPWVNRPPSDIVRDHVRLTLQPVDAPPEPAELERFMGHLRSDELLLYSSDYPHWQFDGDEAIPEGISATLRRKLTVDNPLATYPRLGGLQ